jgi:2-enoate reductase
MVIGGGPAGMEAAITASTRGHEVTLYEKADKLGGMLNYLSIPEFKKDYLEFMNWQISELSRKGVTVKTGVAVTKDIVEEVNPDVVIVATGAVPSMPPITGIESQGLIKSLEVLDGNIPEGDKVIVCGSGLVGAEVAMHLAGVGKKVVLVDQLPTVVPEIEIFSQWVVQAKLAELGIEIKVNHVIKEVNQRSITCKNGDGEVLVEGDAVVIALGMKPDNSLYNELKDLPREVIPVGDVVKARKVIHAIHEGYHAGRRI